MSETQQTLTKSAVKSAMRQNLGISEGDAESLYSSIIKELRSIFQENDFLKIVDFGTFAIRTKEPRMGRNPRTKEEVLIESRRSIRFRPARHLRNIVERGCKNTEKKEEL